MTEIKAPYNVFFGEDGYPLEGGYIFIGLDGLNPLSNPQQVYWDPALTIPAANVRTSGGRPSNNGVVGRLYVPGDYSILVQDKNGRTVYSQLSVAFEYSDLLVTESRGTLTRSARAPLSFNINNIRETGFYTWTNGATTNQPAGVAAGDVFILEVISAPDGAGVILQNLTDMTLGPAYPSYRFTRMSIDDGATWSTWISSRTAYAEDIVLLDSLGAPAATIEYNNVDGTVDLAIGGGTAYPIQRRGEPDAYTAGDRCFQSLSAIIRTNSTSYIAATKSWTSEGIGTVRVGFSVSRVGSSGTAYADVFKNGVAVGAEITNAAQGTGTATSVDVPVVVGDVIEVRAKMSSSSYYCAIRNAYIAAGEYHKGEVEGFFPLESTAGFSIGIMGIGQIIELYGAVSGGNITVPSTASSLYAASGPTATTPNPLAPSATAGTACPLRIVRLS